MSAAVAAKGARWEFLGLALFAGGMAVLAAFLAGKQMLGTQMLSESRVRLERYLEGDADRPFAYRRLVPVAVRAVVAVELQTERLLPTSMIAQAAQPVCRRLARDRIVPAGFDSCRPYAALFVLLWLGLVSFGAGLYLLYRHVNTAPRPEAVLAPLAGLACIRAIQQGGFGHAYDFFVLALMTWGLYFIASQRRVAFWVTFTVACLNKETAVLLLFANAACAYGRAPARSIALESGALLLVFAGIYLAARSAFGGNPGTSLEFSLPQQIQWLTALGPLGWLRLSILAASLGFGWREQPTFVRRASVMFLPQLALCAIGAAPGELRNYYEVLPLVVLIWTRNFLRVYAGATRRLRPAA